MSVSLESRYFIRMSMRAKNCFWALNSPASISAREITLARTVYILMSLGFTPNLGLVLSSARALVLQLVHSPGDRMLGTNSALMCLKSQLFPKLLMMISRVLAGSFFTSSAKSAFVLVAFLTQIWSGGRGCSASMAMSEDISFLPCFFPKLMMSCLLSTRWMMPTPQYLWYT